MKVTFALQNNICRALHKKTQKVYILLKGLNCYFFPRDSEFLFSVLENFRGKQCFNKFKQFLPQLNPVNLNCCLKFKKYSSIYILQFASDELNIKQTD